jgi:hypothetical protein
MDKKYRNLEDTLDRLTSLYQARKYLQRKLKSNDASSEKINRILAMSTFSVDYSIKNKADIDDHVFKL